MQPLQQGYSEHNEFMDRALPKLAACRQKKLSSFVLQLSFDEGGLSRINVVPHPKGLIDCVYRAVVHKEWPRGPVELRYRLTFL